MIRYSGVNHLAMVTQDMNKTILFWRDLLGMRLVAGLGRPGYRHYFFEISENDMIAFFEWGGVEPIPEVDHGHPRRGPLVFDHVSFGVEQEEDLWALKDKLDAAGFWVSEIIDHGFIHSLYSFDPNGIPIEFSHPVEGIDIRQHPRMIDKAPSGAAQEGPEPQPGKWSLVKEPTAPEQWRIYKGAGSELFDGTE